MKSYQAAVVCDGISLTCLSVLHRLRALALCRFWGMGSTTALQILPRDPRHRFE